MVVAMGKGANREYVNILCRDYEVKRYKRAFDPLKHWGLCDKDRATIKLRSIKDDPIFDLDTELHEYFHAILYEVDKDERELLEEDAVRALATGTVKLFHSNPALLERFYQTIKEHVRKTKD